ncbi:MAG: low molecular weight phosphotyrosine protein phosphatase [Melioribacteraceae bacterium]|nr:MAG: low molecular weight phosphotyrosine protein phosphatase [Melioribacteraceae bacterium]
MVRVIFVCLGNICRSPSAEAVMNSLIEKKGLSGKIECDSAGTIAYHAGEPADPRMKKHALKRGYNLTSIARKFTAEDFENFDYIIAMDRSNYTDILALDKNAEFVDKISMMTNYCTEHDDDDVPDPYYGGPQGFEHVLDLLEDATAGLLEKIKEDFPEEFE